MSRKRRTFSSHQKTKIVLEALKELAPLSEIAKKYQVHPSQITHWKKQVLEQFPHFFEGSSADKHTESEEKIALLYQQIGQLQFELDWLKKKSGL